MAHTPIEREEPPRERATLPVRLALVDAGLSDPHACLDHLSHDLLEALNVYEHHIPLPAYGAARVIDSRVYTLSHLDIPLRAATQRRACRSRTHAVAVRDCMRG